MEGHRLPHEMGELACSSTIWPTRAEESFKRSEEARAGRRRRNKLKSDFLANMSHELRTPSTASWLLGAAADGSSSRPWRAGVRGQHRFVGEHLLASSNDLLTSPRFRLAAWNSSRRRSTSRRLAARPGRRPTGPTPRARRSSLARTCRRRPAPDLLTDAQRGGRSSYNLLTMRSIQTDTAGSSSGRRRWRRDRLPGAPHRPRDSAPAPSHLIFSEVPAAPPLPHPRPWRHWLGLALPGSLPICGGQLKRDLAWRRQYLHPILPVELFTSWPI